ncbi:MAG: flagellar hook-length control protein FliK [Methylobacterium sp.]|nr:flagellar hook-length control protein FliK [Methylobacterium sp.]
MPVAGATPDATGAAPDPSTEVDLERTSDALQQSETAPAGQTPPPVAIMQPAPPASAAIRPSEGTAPAMQAEAAPANPIALPAALPASAGTQPPAGTEPAMPGTAPSAAQRSAAAFAAQAGKTEPDAESGEPSSTPQDVADSGQAGAGLAGVLAALQPATPATMSSASPTQPPPATRTGEVAASVAGAQLASAAASAPRGASRPGGGEAATSSDSAVSTKDGEAASFLAANADPSALLAQTPAPAPAAQTPASQAAMTVGHEAQTPAPIPLGAVPMTIGLRSLSGSNTFEIRLDPKDLGRIEVNLAIDKETGAVQASLVVDRPETLALLQRDAGNLQQALTQAGLDAPDGSISLSLRGDGTGGGADGQGSNGHGSNGQGSGAQGSGAQGQPRRAGQETQIPLDAVLQRLYGAGRGIDIRI